jgi:hypothetical protein
MKANEGKWLRCISRSRQNHWYRALLRHIAAHFGSAWPHGVVKGFDVLLCRGIVPVSQSI